MTTTTFEKLPWAFDQLALKIDRIETMLVASHQLPGTRSSQKPCTAKELTEFLGISAASLIRWRKKGTIPHLRVGGAIRYDRDAVIRAIEQNKGKSC